MRITKINVRFGESDSIISIIHALQATFRPFGSLSAAYGVDGGRLAMKMIRWVNESRASQPETAGELIGLVWSATTDQISSVELGVGSVTLRTPRLGTEIRIQCRTGGYDIEVDFGPKGSEARAAAILDAAEWVGVRFNAYAGEEKVEHVAVLNLLREQGQN